MADISKGCSLQEAMGGSSCELVPSDNERGATPYIALKLQGLGVKGQQGIDLGLSRKDEFMLAANAIKPFAPKEPSPQPENPAYTLQARTLSA